ncbi:YitT family protein [Abyssibacter sp.]|jgi:uncharacterized membrane-anchored protein YitT (DUF2179 family)|uniref:YitT family protein n=1 Tax=Abyssibacter sp. TaxID=2320200 RepID=UPI000C410CF0|nr:YitT family protein [Abyssibacter sp.]MBB86351.1 hypothetical protein [Xanthomonadales bacterium]MCK5860443.1 YitT family protein [Abyssibacter sp.]
MTNKARLPRHSLFEDLFALVCAAVLVGMGIYMMKLAGLLTGGTAGLALSLSTIAPVSFGQVFFVMNLPFYLLAIKSLGWRFATNTLVAVTSVSIFADQLDHLIRFEHLNPVFAAIGGGVLVGIGMLITFRHNASLGGVGILAIHLQKRYGVRAGNVQMGVDCAIVLIGFFLVSIPMLLLSIAGAVAMNTIIAVNHKPGRYQIV